MREDSLGKRQNPLKSRPGDNNRNKVPEAYITSYNLLCTVCEMKKLIRRLMQIGTDLVHTKDFRDIFIDVEEKVRG